RAVPAPDPRVAAAFALGWQMAELYRPGRRVRRSQAASGDLPGLSGLDERHILQLGVDQLRAGQTALADTIAGAGLDLPDLGPLQSSVTSGVAEDARRRVVLELHVEVLLVLTAANFRLGKAYGLGRALADTCRNPVDIDSVRGEFESFRIAT